MQGVYLRRGIYPREWLKGTVRFIRDSQCADGAIPWFDGHHADPWNHTEAAMGLSIGGEWEAAERAYRWLADRQNANGSWASAYRDGRIERDDTESNFCAYPATGIWHHYTITQDAKFLRAFWPVAERAIDFVVGMQTAHGDIAWTADRDGHALDDALLAGCSSIHKSMQCALALADAVDCQRPDWEAAHHALGHALRHRPERFDRTWPSKRRYAMDWFYPVLAGALTGHAARQRLFSRWQDFVIDQVGCRCVDNEPWVVVAESCELVMALLSIGESALAREVYSWLHRLRATQGGYWTGYQLDLQINWPAERPTWTAGAVLLAADALTEHTPACQLFTAPLIDAPAPSAAAGQR